MAVTYVRNAETGIFEQVGPGGATTDVTLSQVGKPADASAVGNALSGYSLLSHEHAQYAYKNMMCAYNLLDNSDFRNPVNQRGFAGGAPSGDNVYFIDRWKTIQSAASNIEISLSDSGLGIHVLSGLAGIKQILPRPKTDVTFAAKVNGKIALVYSSYSEGAFMTTDEDIRLFVEWSEDTIQVCMRNNTSEETQYSVEWAALYEGEYTVDTIPMYYPKGYAAEMLECKRYLQVFPYSYSFFFGTSGDVNGSGARMLVPLNIPMYIESPTVPTFMVNISTNDGFVKQTTFTASVVRANGPWLSLYGDFAESASTTAYALIGAQLRNEDLIVSAEF